MTESKSPAVGKFVWYDLMTTDVKTSRDFYSRLFAWEAEEDKASGGMYTLFKAQGKHIGGMGTLSPSQGVPPHWVAYVTVSDVEANARKAQELGGKVAVPPKEIPEVGAYAVLQDPTGAFICTFQGKNPEMDSPPASGPGTVCWNELMTSDLETAAGFYSSLFGWSTTTQDMGSSGPYTMYQREDKNIAGMMKMPPGAPYPPRWLSYVEVTDIDASAALAGKLGGKVLHPPTDIPNVGRFSVIADPVGAVIALFQGK